MSTILHYRAGPRAMALIRREGLRPAIIRVLAGPASGPRWLVLTGIDRALIDGGFAAPPPAGQRRLLVGSSAGAWRMLAHAARDPHAAHDRLVSGYIRQSFRIGVTPAVVSETYRRVIGEVIPEDDRRHIVDHATSDVAIHVTGLRWPLPWRRPACQVAAVLVASTFYRGTRRAIGWLTRRVLLHTRPERFAAPFDGTIAPLTTETIVDAALASGTVPIYMQPVRGSGWAPPGLYMDGGLADFHLHQRYVAPGEGVVLLPHYQERICATWFDKDRQRHAVPPDLLADVLQIYPSEDFIASLPGGAPPDRNDFITFHDEPEERMRRWTEVASRSAELGVAFLRDIETGAWADRLEAIV